MTCPIPPRWFRRLLIRATVRGTVGTVDESSIGVLGFTVRFPGSTPRDASRWLKAHGYVYGSGRAWCRVDRKQSRMNRSEVDVHADVVKSRRRSRAVKALHCARCFDVVKCAPKQTPCNCGCHL